MERLIGKIGSVVFGFMIFGTFMVSCVSLQDKTVPPQDRQTIQIIGHVEVKFTTWQILHIWTKESIAQKAYSRLLAEARKTYQGNIDIVNVTADGSFNALTLLAPIPIYGAAISNFQTIRASGDVISYGGAGRAVTTGAVGVEGALERAANEVAETFSARSRIAIVYITAQDQSTTDFIAGELEHILRRQNFIIIDRSELDRVRAEQRFGTTGEVDDSTAARIGNIAGANIVITGRVDGEGELRRLRLRALDTSNAQVVGTASERL